MSKSSEILEQEYNEVFLALQIIESQLVAINSGILSKLKDLESAYLKCYKIAIKNQDDHQAARYKIKMASIIYEMGNINLDIDLLQKALSEAKKGLESINIIMDPSHAIIAYSTIGLCCEQLAYNNSDVNKEIMFRDAILSLNAAEYIARTQHCSVDIIKIYRDKSRVYGQMFYSERVENLSKSIHYASMAIREAEGIPSYNRNHLALMYMQIADAKIYSKGDRKQLIKEGIEIYAIADQLINPQEYPRLKSCLENNLHTFNKLLTEEDYSFPESESRNQFDFEIDQFIKANDFENAITKSWEMLYWSWSLPEKPNPHTAYAHINLGQAYFQYSKDTSQQACNHFYTALLIIWGALPPDFPIQQITPIISKNLRLSLQQLNKEQFYEAFLNQAKTAFLKSIQIYNEAKASLTTDTQQAYQNFQTAVQLYPFFPEALLYLAKLQWRNFNNIKSAVYYLNLAARIFPIPEILLERAQLNMHLQQYQKSILDFNMVLRLNKINLIALSERSYCYEQLGQFNNAVTDLESLMKYSEKNDNLEKNQDRINALLQKLQHE